MVEYRIHRIYPLGTRGYACHMLVSESYTLPKEVRILLVEDDEDDFVLMRDMLAEIPGDSYKPVLRWVTSHEDALEEMDRHDVCLMDYRLDDYDGLDLLKEAKARGVRVPIIFLTGQGRYEIDMVAMKHGAADYLVKDQITLQTLERAIRYAMERAHAFNEVQKARDELEKRVEERTRELRKANEALARSSEKIKHFAYYVSHDLKSPAVGIHGLARRLRDKYAEELGEAGGRYCDSIMMAAEQLFRLVEMINLYITSKELPIRLEELRLQELLHRLREEFEEPVKARGVKLRLPDADSRIRADRMGLLRCLRNLVDNALKYGGSELRTISVLYDFDEDTANHIIAVQDDGKGLDLENLDHIFGVFTRNHAPTDGLSTGLGLAIVREIVEQHQGTVWAVRGASKGITIHLSIPENLEINADVEESEK